MKMVSFLLVGLLTLPSLGLAEDVSPTAKVLQMLAGLQQKIIKEGEEAQKAYDEFSEWCEDRSKNIGFEIKTAKAEIEELGASIEKSTSTIGAMETKIEELSSSIAKDQADLKAATKIREEEASDFAAEEKETTEVIGMLDRAINILEKEMKKSGGAALVQLQSAGSLAQALGALVQASVFSTADASRLTAFVQDAQQERDDQMSLGAPAAAVYEGHSDGIIDTLEGLLEKAQEQLDKARKTEETSLHQYEMLKQSLEDEVEYSEKDLDGAKKSLAAAGEAKATAEGDLEVTTADLKEDTTTLSTLHSDCMTGAEDFQASTKSRGEELNALAQAKKILSDAMGASAQTYSAASFFQLSSSLSTGADLANYEAVRFVRDLAKKVNSEALAQLASRMASAIRFGSKAGSDPFAKVKSLISDMITRLEADAKSDATHKAYCDKETSETTAKKDEKKALIEKLSTKIGSMQAKSAKLKEQVSTLQKELAELAASQSEMDKIRSAEKALYTKNSAEMKQGIEAVKKALGVLRDYYAKEDKSHAAADGAGGGIISMLEVVESDFTKGLSEMEVTEATSADEYEKVTQENKLATTMKNQDVKYKTKESAGLDKSAAETSSDLEAAQAELDALMEYLEKLGKMCIAKAEPYAERKSRREAEIAGLKEALSILEGETVLLETTSRRGLKLRGHHMSLIQMMRRDCPYCAAQCVDKCHSDGKPYVQCLTDCADAGKGK